MRTKFILQAGMLIVLLTMLVLSPVAYGQDSSAATGGGSGGSSATTASGGGGTSAACTTLWDPVCGTDGVTYSNACFAGVAGANVTYEGECRKESCAQDGEMCAGIAGIMCCDGLSCQMDGTYPDASGTCVKETPKENRFRNAYWECYDSKESYEGGPTSCKSSETWQEYAEESCKGHCNSNADATATTDNVEGVSPKCGVNTFKVWNPCYETIECSRYLKKEKCEAAGGRYVEMECPPCPAGAACEPCMIPYCECTNVVYCEDEPYNPDCVCREGERVIVYEEPPCKEGERCPLMAVRIKYECVTKDKVIKARLGESFELEAPQTAVIVDYNEMHVKLTAISAGKRYIGPPAPVEGTETTAVDVTGGVVEETESSSVISSEIMPPFPVDRYVAHLVITMPGSNELVEAKEEVRATIASITGRTVAASAGGGGSGAAATSTASGGGSAVSTTATTGVAIAPSAAQVLWLRQGESAEVFGATLTVEKLDKEHGLFVVSKEEILPCPEYNKCPDGSIAPCYQEGDMCICETCEALACVPTVCADGQMVDCWWSGETCVCEACPIEDTPLCGNGICEEGEGMVCQGAGSGLGTAEEVCYISCPEDCGTIEERECDGCVSGARCLPYGSRRLIEGTALYCDFDGAWQGQLAEGDACQNDYECATNSCASGKCMDLEKEVAGLKALVQKLLDLFAKLFG